MRFSYRQTVQYGITAFHCLNGSHQKQTNRQRVNVYVYWKIEEELFIGSYLVQLFCFLGKLRFSSRMPVFYHCLDELRNQLFM